MSIGVPLVGRQRELNRLLELLAGAGQGQGGIVLVAGEAGIGKTRLVLELAARARAQGRQVLLGRAYEPEGLPPYLPFVEALRAYVRQAPLDDLRSHLGDGAADVALLVPEVRDRLPGLLAPAPDPPPSPEQQRYRLFESVCDLLLGVAGMAPGGLLLVLDDLQWADAPTMSLLRHLMRRLAGTSVLVVGTYRTVGLDRTQPLTDLLAEVSREGALAQLRLAALSLAETGAFIQEMAGAPAAPAVVEAVHRQTAGNPFFVREVVRHLQGERRDLLDPVIVAGGVDVPEGVRQVIGQRRARLSPATTRLLQAGAVMGEGFTFELAQAVTGEDPAALLDAVEEALAAGLLAAEGAEFHFSHALIREALYDELSPPRRQRLHLRAAQAIEVVHAGALELHLASLAGHYRRAGAAADVEKVIVFSIRAGEAAWASFAYEEAAQQWEAALALMEGRRSSVEERAALLARLSNATHALGWDYYPQSISHLERALLLYEEIGEAERVAAMHVRLGSALSFAGATMDLPRAMAHFRAAEPVLGRGAEREAQGRLYYGLAHSAAWGARAAEGLSAARRAVEIGGRTGNEALRIGAAHVYGWHLAASGNLAEGLASLERAWERADRLRNAVGAFGASAWRANWGFFLGDPRDALEWRARELARQRQPPGRRHALLNGMASACAETGDLAEARRLHAEAGAATLHATLDLVVVLYAEPLIAFRSGDWEHAEAFWSAARARHRRTGGRWSEADFDCWLARLSRVRGDHVRAESLLREALAIGVEGSCVAIEMWARPELAALYVETGRPTEAQGELVRCREILAGGEDWRGLAGRVAVAEAVAAAAASPGSPETEGRGAVEADVHFAQAVEIFRRYSLRWDEGEALYCWGRTLLAAGRPAEAADRLEAAGAVYRQIGAGGQWIAQVEALRKQFTAEFRHPRMAAHADGLTPREVEVLRLLAGGCSNKEIAANLVLSVRTVERHVANIYAKVSAHNRAEATAYAARHGLIDLVRPPA